MVISTMAFQIWTQPSNRWISKSYILYYFFQACILEPTIRVVLNSRSSLIDNIYINTYDKRSHSGNCLDKVIDHIPNFCIIEDTYKVKKKNRKVRIRDNKTVWKRQILKDLEKHKNLDLLQYKD